MTNWLIPSTGKDGKPLPLPDAGWQVYLVETLTGDLLSRVPLASGSAVDALNTAGEVKIRTATPWLLRQPRWRWSKWSASLLACFDGEPIAAGPIVAEPDGDREFVDLVAGDMWSILAKRVATDQDYPTTKIPRAALIAQFIEGDAGADEQQLTDACNNLLDTGNYDPKIWNPLSFQEDYPGIDMLFTWRADPSPIIGESIMHLMEGSLGTIARRLVERAQWRPMGELPIVFPSPEERGRDRERNYYGFNLGNNSVEKLLKEITQVINGPDISFRPRWRKRGRSIDWAMYHGTEGMPQIPQQHTYTVDLTAPRSNTVAVKVSSESEQAHRVYGTGAGQDKGILIKIENAPIPQHMPFLESVMSDTQVVNPDLLVRKARGVLDQGKTVQISSTVDSATMPLHTWWSGDEMTVRMPGGWPQIDAGTYSCRAIKRSWNFAEGRRTSVEFQPERVVR